MNTKDLKKEFKDFYKDFFSTCATVVSAPGNFIWGGNVGLLAGSLGIIQNLPLRVCVGFEETMGGEVVFGKCLNFDCAAKMFIPYKIEDHIKKELTIFIKQEIKKNLGKNRFKGLKIHLLPEMPIGYGLSASGAMSAALSCAIFLHYKKIQSQEIEAWQKIQTAALLADHLFDKIFRLAWKIEAIFHGGLTSGIGSFAPLISSRSPIVYFCEPPHMHDPHKINYSCDIGQSQVKNYELIDRIKYGAFKLSEISSNPVDYFFPFHFGLINSGAGGSSVVANRALQQFENSILEISDFSQKNLQNFFQKSFNSRPAYDRLFSDREAGKIGEAFFLLAALLSMNIIYSLYKLNQKFLSPGDFNRLIKNMNCYLNIYGISQTLSVYTNKFFELLKEKTRNFEDEFGLAFKLSNNTHGGYVIFATATQRSRDKLMEIISEMQKELSKNISIDWTSWQDGLEDKGAIVEQSLIHKIYSPFISRRSILVLHLDKFGLHDDLYTFEEFSNTKKNMDVILDSLNNEIYIRGEKLTSKDLRSATHTISVLSVLLKNVNQTIPKNDLPPSTYLQDRNEFQSKIVSPMVKAIEKRLMRRISFNLKGPIVNFTVKFDPKDVEFHYIEREF